MILNFKVSVRLSAETAFQNLREACEKMKSLNLNPKIDIDLITDGGPENDNRLIPHYLSLEDIKIRHFIAQKDIVCSNSMIEAKNKCLKYRFLLNAQIQNESHARAFLEKAIHEENFLRPHDQINGHTPYELYHKIPLNHQLIRQNIHHAVLNRIEINSKTKCPVCPD